VVQAFGKPNGIHMQGIPSALSSQVLGKVVGKVSFQGRSIVHRHVHYRGEEIYSRTLRL
jgi:hypothetical protein